jgi:hypothetical protein
MPAVASASRNENGNGPKSNAIGSNLGSNSYSMANNVEFDQRISRPLLTVFLFGIRGYEYWSSSSTRAAAGHHSRPLVHSLIYRKLREG